ncbi:MAG: hypothetical protein LBV30_06830 [Propionibacteriaceae bacterium]|jgi:hypothetical protein|nr:hypothetical protein [Propionibacteriaceae bacterium]
MSSYILRPRTPAGTWIALIILILGTALAVISLTWVFSLPLRIIGCILALLGLVLLVITLVAATSRQVRVTLDSAGYYVTGPSGEFTGSWGDVTDVAVSRKTAKIALWHGPNHQTIIAHPAGQMDDDFRQLREGIRRRLNASFADDRR